MVNKIACVASRTAEAAAAALNLCLKCTLLLLTRAIFRPRNAIAKDIALMHAFNRSSSFLFTFLLYIVSVKNGAMSDADSAGSHSRASKASRSAGGRVAQVRKQFEAASALPSPSARTTVSAPQVPAAKSAPKSAGRKRKARQQRLAATAAVSPDASGSTPAAPPAKPPATSWCDVLMGNSPDDRHTIQALVAEVEQLKKLINNNRAQSDSQHDNCRQHRMESSPQTEHMLRYSKRQNLVFFGVAESSACTTPEH